MEAEPLFETLQCPKISHVYRNTPSTETFKPK